SGQKRFTMFDKLALGLESLDGGEAQAGQDGYGLLKRNLLIPSILIFDSRVWRGMPSFAAAPLGPPTRPRASANAVSIASRSRSSRAVASGTVGPEGCRFSRLSHVSSTQKVSPSHKITARST